MKQIAHSEAEILRMYTDGHDDALPFGITHSAVVNMDTVACYVQTLIDGLSDQFTDEDELANEVEDRLRAAVAKNEGDMIEIAPYANVDPRWHALWGDADLLDGVVLKVYSTEQGAPWRNHWGKEYRDAVNFMAWCVEQWPDNYDSFAQKYGVADPEADPESAQTQTTAASQHIETAPKEGVETTTMAQTKNLSEWFTRYTEMQLSNGYKPFDGEAEYTTDGKFAFCTIKKDNYYEDEDGNIIDGFIRMKINIDKAPHKMECSQWIEDFRYDWSGATKCAALWEIMTTREATHEEMMAAMTTACAKRYAKANGLEQTQTPQPPLGGVAPTATVPVASATVSDPEPTAVASQPKTMPSCGLWWNGHKDDAFYAVAPTANEGELQVCLYDMEEDKYHSSAPYKADYFTQTIENSDYTEFADLDTLRTDYPGVYADLLKEGFIAEVVKVEIQTPQPPLGGATPEPDPEPQSDPDPATVSNGSVVGGTDADTEAERKAQEEAERLAAEKAEQERIEAERKAAEEKAAAEKAEAERLAAEKAAAEEEERKRKEAEDAEKARAIAASTLKPQGVQKNEHRHPLFNVCKTILSVGENVYAWGAPGCGKTHMGEQLASEFGLRYSGNGCIYQPYEIVGFVDANGNYHETAYVKAYREGGFHLWDEFDRSIPAAVTCANSSIANGFIDLPNGERVYKHKNFKLMSCGNTNGEGATDEFEAANKFEASTRDRFTFVEMTYDEAVELHLAEGDNEMISFIHDLRHATKECRYKLVISYRAIQKLCKFMKAMTPSDAIKYAVIGSMSSDNLRCLTNNLQNKSGRYYTMMQALTKEYREKEQMAA